ncbi:hypothetical protein BV898_02384 [Hypsibius exemplaris]|uniref:G-protein coupled receptors family 1 profile domain-containing protein n=1 Tax=Hypsibius exemplaris TaxID=2072580 RepID=A0A1W0X8P2_HYPEX|nr:hypothetical protein BV898_02384 [Hypsibius exemplaris]
MTFNVSTSNNSIPEVFSHGTIRTFTLWLSVVLIGNIFGGIANVIIAVVTLNYKPLRICISSPLIAHCAILDSLRALVVYPGVSLLAYLAPDYPAFPAAACRYIGGIGSLIVFTTNWAYCCLAGHRFCAAIFPHHFHYLSRRCIAVAINCLPWLLSLLFLAFPVFEIHVKFVYTRPWSACVLGPLGGLVSGLFIAVVTYLPCAVSGFCYVVICLNAWLMSSSLKKTTPKMARIRGTLQRRFQISRLLFVCSLFTVVMTLPLPLALAWFPAYFTTNFVAQMWVRLPQFLASAFNPIVYMLVSRDYRNGVLKILRNGDHHAFY